MNTSHQTNAGGGQCEKSLQYMKMRVSVPVYIMAMMSFVGWFLFVAGWGPLPLVRLEPAGVMLGGVFGSKAAPAMTPTKQRKGMDVFDDFEPARARALNDADAGRVACGRLSVLRALRVTALADGLSKSKDVLPALKKLRVDDRKISEPLKATVGAVCEKRGIAAYGNGGVKL